MTRLLAMLAAFVAFTLVLVVGLSTWTVGEIVHVTADDIEITPVKSHRSVFASRARKGPPRTRCTAQVEYRVGGRAYTTRDLTVLSSAGNPVSACPYSRGQRAIVFYTDQHPEAGMPFTSPGPLWCLFLLLPLLLVAFFVWRIRDGRFRSPQGIG